MAKVTRAGLARGRIISPEYSKVTCSVHKRTEISFECLKKLLNKKPQYCKVAGRRKSGRGGCNNSGPLDKLIDGVRTKLWQIVGMERYSRKILYAAFELYSGKAVGRKAPKKVEPAIQRKEIFSEFSCSKLRTLPSRL